MRYAGNNYLWINDMQPAMVIHPIKPALNGTDLSNFKDQAGTYLFKEMVQVSKDNGQGFVEDLWPDCSRHRLNQGTDRLDSVH